MNDQMRAIDYMLTRPEIDPKRIGITGNSGGGTQTVSMMVCDDRIAAAAPATFLTGMREFLYTGMSQDMEQMWPACVEYGFDHVNSLMLFAPKPVAVLALTSDFFPIEGTRKSVADYFDNETILPDMKKIYDTLRIQTKAGVFLDDALSECYLAAKNRRLKSALLELTTEISIKKNIEEALENFNGKFRNEHIKTFCMVINQAQDSGKSSQLLKDLSDQMKDLQHSINLKNKEALDRKVQIVELLIFVGLLAVTVYSLGLEITTSLGI